MEQTHAAAALQRALRQQLESLSRAGLTHLSRKVPQAFPEPAPEANPHAGGEHSVGPVTPNVGLAVPAVSPRAAALPPIEKSPMPASRSPSSRPQSSRPQSSRPQSSRTPSPSPSTAGTQAAGASKPQNREDRVARLTVLSGNVAACQRCQELATTRTQTVFGVGNPEAKILFIGEAPGADEDKQGEPFVGKAGQLLNKIIEACRLKREEIYICNILKCRPPGNRTPLPDECTNCREFLDAQLAIIDPDYIVCWGAVAAQNLLNSVLPIGKMRGRLLTHGRAKVLCTYHPSYLLRNPAAKKDVWDDMKSLMADMGVSLA